LPSPHSIGFVRGPDSPIGDSGSCFRDREPTGSTVTYLATFGCLAFVIYLFAEDVRAEADSTRGLWIPLVWMFFAGSRWLSAWLDLQPPLDSADAYLEGSPIDRAVFLALIIAGILELRRRRIDWAALLSTNKLLAAYLLYCLISVCWSDVPYVAFKRWFKDLGNPIMILVILTAPNPTQALAKTLRRLSFLFLPLSVLFVRYYPELGRGYKLGGEPMYTGIGHQKNDLGLICLVTGLYFVWQIVQDRTRFLTWAPGRRIEVYILLATMIWLLHMSDSQTSLSCLVTGVLTIAASRLPFISARPRRLAGLLVGASLAYFTLDSAFDLKAQVLSLLGRSPNLTNRTELWKLLLDVGTDPVLGTGFMSFWSGERMELIWRLADDRVNQAHSGYIEQYLNLGYVGVAFMVLLLLKAFARARSMFDSDPSMALFRLCFVTVAVLYNYTEASFYGMSNMWILTLIAIIDVPEAALRGKGRTGTASPPIGR
jgi:hypothetical protein